MTDIKTIAFNIRMLLRDARHNILVARIDNMQDEVSLKSLNNLVTEVDKNIEKFLVTGLRNILPPSTFLTEEQTVATSHGEYQWIIDPIDGTTNFVHGVPAYAISLALRHNEEIVFGIVHEINRNEQFWAIKGEGAFLNDTKINVTDTHKLENSLIATGFPYDEFDREEAYWKALRSFTHQTRGIRRLGSAAVDLCYVACGRFDCFFEYSLNPWDVAGGALVVQEAGGQVTDFSGNSNWLFGKEIVASNKHLHQASLDIITKYF
ncbi:MAG: inositol monophosphatase family protein [Chitinophagales bacterium]